MPACPNQSNACPTPDATDLLLSIERRVARKAVAFIMGVSERFVGYQVSGDKKLSFTHLMKLWTCRDTEVTDPIARFLETHNPAYRVTRHAGPGADDPQAEARRAIRDGVAALEEICAAMENGEIDPREMGRIEEAVGATVERYRKALDGCRLHHRNGSRRK